MFVDVLQHIISAEGKDQRPALIVIWRDNRQVVVQAVLNLQAASNRKGNILTILIQGDMVQRCFFREGLWLWF